MIGAAVICACVNDMNRLLIALLLLLAPLRSQEAFPETTVGVLGEFTRGPEGLGRVCSKYWKPVYAYVRAAWAKSNEDAKDLTQAFFLWLLEERVLEQFDPV